MRRIAALCAITILLLSAVACTPTPPPAAAPAVSPPHTFTVEPSPAPSPSSIPLPSPAPEPSPEPEPEPEPEPYDYTGPVPPGEPVEDAWFADAAFLGDSRIDGMKMYSGLKTPDYFSYKGLSVFNVATKECIPSGGKTLTVLDALAKGDYGKVYVSLGVNELGWIHAEPFYEAYLELVDEIHVRAPGADVYLQLIIPVNEDKCKANNIASYINNEQIALYNSVIRQVAVEREVYFLDVGETFVDEEGILPREMTGDGVHLTKAGYGIWKDYLLAHTVPRPEGEMES